jgi:hypothetical protein
MKAVFHVSMLFLFRHDELERETVLFTVSREVAQAVAQVPRAKLAVTGCHL